MCNSTLKSVNYNFIKLLSFATLFFLLSFSIRANNTEKTIVPGGAATLNPGAVSCNQKTPLINGSVFDNLTATITNNVPSLIPPCLGSISGTGNLTDADLNNVASISITGIGCNGELAVSDSNDVYPAGTFAGFKISATGLLQASIGATIKIKTYQGGSLKETFNAVTSTIGVNSTLVDSSGNTILGFVTTQSFNEVRIEYTSLVGVLFSNTIYYAVIENFCAGPALNCNEKTTLSNPNFPVIINSSKTGISGLACVGCSVNNAENLISASTIDFATINLAVGVLGSSGSISVKDVLSTYPIGTFAGFEISNTALLGVDLLGGLTLTTYNNGVQVETFSGSSGLILAKTSLLNGDGRGIVGFVTTQVFDEIQLSVFNPLVGVNIGTTNVYGAIIQKNCPVSLVCDQTYFLNEGASGFPVIVNSVNTGLAGIACVGCSVSDTQNVISTSTSDFALISTAVGVASSASIAVKDLVSTYPIGSVAGFAIEDTGGLLQLDLLNSLEICTYLNGVQQECSTTSNLLNLTAVIDIFGTAAGRYNIGFQTTKSYDEIKISVGSLVSAINSIRVFGAFVDSRTANDPSYGLVCNLDSDGDGVLDTVEKTDGTNPNDNCSLVIASQTLAPNAAWNAADCDSDGVTNGQEITNGTNPLN
ncbi:thrombospondin type 3 repeat-containing protein, partial [Flavobacterium frigoris]|uniref:thrombospondin type 3 repeat-containing protein n=1 Tax=Flavobacterium frigoris TaxID=229204 RepID=UPI00058C58A7